MGKMKRRDQQALEANIREWETNIKILEGKLHSARALEKIQYYEEIKALREKLAAARKRYHE